MAYHARRHFGDHDENSGQSVSTVPRRLGVKVSRTSAPNPFAVYVHVQLTYMCIIRGPRILSNPHYHGRGPDQTAHSCAGNPTDLTLPSCFFSPRAQAPGHGDYDCNHIHSPQLPPGGASLPIPNSRQEKGQPAHSQSRTTCIRPTGGPIRRQISPSALPPSQALDPYAHACTTVTGGRPR